MTLSLALAVHLLSSVVWVGGMFFMHFVLRPTTNPLPLEEKVALWDGFLTRFIRWVWVSVILLPVSGYWMVVMELGGGPFGSGTHVILMQVVGWTMIALFLYLWFVPFRKMKHRVKELLIPEAGIYLLRIRTIATINLVLGIITTVIASAGRFW